MGPRLLIEVKGREIVAIYGQRLRHSRWGRRSRIKIADSATSATINDRDCRIAGLSRLETAGSSTLPHSKISTSRETAMTKKDPANGAATVARRDPQYVCVPCNLGGSVSPKTIRRSSSTESQNAREVRSAHRGVDL
jgi:hypothetical protein